MTQLFEVTVAEKIACIKREFDYRERVYPKLIDQGKMTREKAARELEIMRAILHDYETQEQWTPHNLLSPHELAAMNAVKSCPHGWRDWDDCPVCGH